MIELAMGMFFLTIVVLLLPFAMQAWARKYRGMLFVLMLAIAAGCAAATLDSDTQGAPAPNPDPPLVEIVIDSATSAFFSMLQSRLPFEWVMCVYGTDDRPRSITVEYVQATIVHWATPLGAKYAPCPRSPRFLGTVHTHLTADYNGDGVPDAACWFSKIDVQSFAANSDAILDLVACGDGQIKPNVKPLPGGGELRPSVRVP